MKKIKEIYECPYCGNSEFLKFNIVRESILPGTVSRDSEFKNEVIDIIPALCPKCKIGFSAYGPSDEYKEYCTNRYEFIKPGAGVGSSRFNGFLNLVKRYSNKDSNILEIGFYDGYILKSLNALGYKNLVGYDPNACFESFENIKVYKDYFTKDVKLEEKFDVILLQNLISMVPPIDELMASCIYGLNDNGYIIIETPRISAVHALQSWRYMPCSFDVICKKHSLRIVEFDYDDKQWFKNSHIRVVLQKSSDIEYKPYFDTKQTQDMFEKSVSLYKEPVVKTGEKDRLCNLLKANKDKKIVIWGTGNASFAYLEACLNELGDKFLKSLDIVMVDSDKSRNNTLFITPFNTYLDVFYAMDYLKNQKIDLMVFGVMSSYFINEIKQSIKDINCSFNDEFVYQG